MYARMIQAEAINSAEDKSEKSDTTHHQKNIFKSEGNKNWGEKREVYTTENLGSCIAF